MNWLPGIFRRNQLYGDLGEEMRLHLEERTEQFMGEGMSRTEAEQAARRAFGNATVLEERSREVWQFPLVESLGDGLETGIPAAGKIAWLCRYGHPHPGDRNRRQRGSFQRAQQRTVQAAALSACRAIGSRPDDRSRGRGAGGLLQWSPPLVLHVFHFRRAESDVSIVRCVEHGAQPMSPASPSRMKCTLSPSVMACCKRSVCRLSLAAGCCRLIKIRMVRKLSCSATAIGNAASAEIDR